MSKIALGEYIFRRVASLGIRHVLGVPGDFNLHLLDYIYHVPELTWVGCCNELNAAYAADGYTRVKGLPAVLLTTYGVGELSAINGVAGAYAEHAGMIHIVGMTSRQVQKERPVVHHTLAPNMDHCLYMEMSKSIRHTHGFLDDESTFTQEIDRVIAECVQSRLPCYLFVPMDTPAILVDASPLSRPLSISITNPSAGTETEIAQKITSAFTTRKNPVILADVLCIRHGGRDVIRELAELTGLPSFACPLSKGIIDEDKPYFNGVYGGNVSFLGIQDMVESSDFVLNVGPLLSDSNTGGYTRNIQADNLVLLAHDCCVVFGDEFPGYHFLPILTKVLENLKTESLQLNVVHNKRLEAPTLRMDKNGPIYQDFVWQRLGRWLKPNDIVLTDCGTAQFGMFDAVLPKNTTTITSVFWSSIGFAVGACLGACLAAKELGNAGRIVLIEGDGALQMTVQEISTCIRYGLKPVIFIVNNNGYSIERAIHGPESSYNDINTQWDYQGLLSFFGARQSRSFRCSSVVELETILADPEFGSGQEITLCEMVLDKFDYPWRLATQIEAGLGRPLEKRLDYNSAEHGIGTATKA